MSLFNYDWLNIIINFIAIPSIVTAILSFILKEYLSNKIDSYFQTKLVSFQHQLDLSTEAEKFNYQRKIQDFNLYTNKKHEKYIELYEIVLEVKSNIYNFHFGSEGNQDKLQKINVSFLNYKKYYESSKLYLTSSIDNKLNELRGTLAQLVTKYQEINFFPLEVNRNLKSESIDGLQKQFEVQITELTVLLKEELSIGYYKEN